jgi:CRP-like cAMP-binding protein
MSIEDDIACLEAVPTFRLLGPHALRILAIGSESRTLEQGDVLFAVGDAADCGYVVQDGSLRLTQPARDQRHDPSAMVVGPGALLGELALIIDTTRPVTAAAAEPSSVMRISRHLFRKTLEGFPDAAQRLREHMAARARETAAEISRVTARLDTEPNQRIE